MNMIKTILLSTCLATCLSACIRSSNLADSNNKNDHMSDINVCKSVRIPAEWEPHEATWMQWPGKYEKIYREEFAELIGALQKYEPIVIVYSYPARARQSTLCWVNSNIACQRVTCFQNEVTERAKFLN